VIDGRGGSWNRDDVIVFSPNSNLGAIQRVSAGGGLPVDVTRRNGTYRFPVFLPDGRHFLYLLVAAAVNQNGVYLSSLDAKENRRVLADVSSVAFSAGRLLFIRKSTLLAQSFDVASGQTIGEALPVADGVSFANVAYYAPVTIFRNRSAHISEHWRVRRKQSDRLV
jgi:hypothetical protein